MAKSIPEQQLQDIEAVVSAHPEGISIQDIQKKMGKEVARRTLQYHLKYLVNEGRLIRGGNRRSTKYLLPSITKGQAKTFEASKQELNLEFRPSKQGVKIQEYVRKPIQARNLVGYERTFLEMYRPNVTAYLSAREREHLREIGTPTSGEQPAGTFAKQILNRLIIDLSWNSSRLEGNTYSLLDTKRLIAFGHLAEGKTQLEVQMILNHKDAVEFLVHSAEEIGFNRYTILNLHALLANNLLADPESMGRLRRIAVGIEKSTFQPLQVPQLLEECFDQILTTAKVIENPFEQALFVMIHLPYLQPFDDVNKRVSRLAANIPFVKANLIPLSCTGVPTTAYTEAILGVYELNRIDLLKDVFIWAYERSAKRYRLVKQSLGEPDPFHQKHREALFEIVQAIVLERLDKNAAFQCIVAYAEKYIGPDEKNQFRQVAENEVLGLHEGNFVRYRIKPTQFKAWLDIWRKPLKKDRTPTQE
ncbi:MAG: Fic family protein [Gammaproteobacteria bacterium]|nr:Fic family protein [Gammaproteobacteria bacterium]